VPSLDSAFYLSKSPALGSDHDTGHGELPHVHVRLFNIQFSESAQLAFGVNYPPAPSVANSLPKLSARSASQGIALAG
jgi:hypothetical protein